MAALADLLFYIALALFFTGLLLNIKYVFALPGKIPRNARWPVMVWLVMLTGLGSWFRSSTDTGVTTVTSIDSSAITQVASIAIAGMTMLLMSGRSFDSRNFHFPFVLLLIFAVVGVLTAPISAYPTLALFKALSVVVAVMLAAMAIKPLINARDPSLLFNSVYVYFAFISFLAVLGGGLHLDDTRMPSSGVFGFMLRGWPALGANSLSYVAAVVFVISLRRMFSVKHFRQRLLYLGVGSTGFIALVVSQGRTSLVSAFIAILFMVYFIREMRPFRYIILGSSVFLLMLIILTGSAGDWIGGLTEYMRRGVDDEELESLSGRTHAWSMSWDLFVASPMIGYGFYATGKTLLAPHNAYFAVLLNGGLLGFLPWLIAVAGGFWVIFSRLLKRSWRSFTAQNSCYMEMLAVMIVQFFRTITSQDLTIHSYSMLVFLSVLIYIYARQRISTDGGYTDASGGPDNKSPVEVKDGTSRRARILQVKRRG